MEYYCSMAGGGKMNEKVRAFFFPKLTLHFFIRAGSVALFAYLFFSFVLTPFMIRGKSMENTYHDGGFNFVFKERYLFSAPKRGDVVLVRMAGDEVMLLKRVVALSGEEVSFKNGVLFINGKALSEPYVKGPCDWNLPPRRVDKGNVYLIGDNRNMPMQYHDFGQVSVRSIVGGPLW